MAKRRRTLSGREKSRSDSSWPRCVPSLTRLPTTLGLAPLPNSSWTKLHAVCRVLVASAVGFNCQLTPCGRRAAFGRSLLTPELLKAELAKLSVSDPLRRPGLLVDVTPVPEGSECDQQVFLEVQLYAKRGFKAVTETADHDLLRYMGDAPGSYVIYCVSPSKAMLLEHAPGSAPHLANLKKAETFYATQAAKAKVGLTKVTKAFENAQAASTSARAALKTATVQQATHKKGELDRLSTQRADYQGRLASGQQARDRETVRWVPSLSFGALFVAR